MVLFIMYATQNFSQSVLFLYECTVICNSKQTLIHVKIGVFSFETNKALWL